MVTCGKNYFLNMNMKRHTLILSVASLSVLLSGCVNPDGSTNNTGTGALIGAAAGALAGGLFGNAADREQEARLKAQYPQTYERVDQGSPLSVADVKALAKAGISEDVIVSQIKSSRTVFHLTAADIIDLREAGVSDKVVNYMINTPSTVGATAETTRGTVTR